MDYKLAAALVYRISNRKLRTTVLVRFSTTRRM